MPSTCILCQQDPPIENSHIVPKFVIRRLKTGNPLQTLVHSDVLNKIFQDGWKEDYLCTACEQRFSKLEGWFCKSVYDPFLAGTQPKLNYGPELGLFAASLAFRFIRYAIDKNPSKPVPLALTGLYENLRVGLLADSLSPITSRSYVQFLVPVTSLEKFPPGVNTYFFEAIDGKLFTYVLPPAPESWLVFVKLPGVFFIHSALDLRQVFAARPELLAGHEIVSSGVLDSSSQAGVLSALVEDIFCERSVEIQANYSRMSPARISKMTQKIGNVANKQQYRAHQTYLLDMKLLSDFEAKHGKQGTPSRT
jgi:hypothetical protein